MNYVSKIESVDQWIGLRLFFSVIRMLAIIFRNVDIAQQAGCLCIIEIAARVQ